MTHQGVIISLLHRLGNNQQSAIISFDEIRHWPPQILAVLLKEEIIEQEKLAKTITCLGCTENCFKPVHILPSNNGKPPRHFIGCDENDYMGKIPVQPEQLQQWRITIKQLALWVSKKLKLRSSSISKKSHEIPVGLMITDKYHCQITLNNADVLSLRINQQTLPLVELLNVEGDKLTIDRLTIEDLAKHNISSSKKTEYQPSTARRDARKLDTQSMYTDWQKAYRQLKREHPTMSDSWISKKIAKMDIAKDRDSETIRKNMKG